MERMTKQEAIDYIGSDGRCPRCRVVAARMVIRYQQGVDEGIIADAERIIWNLKGNERHV